VQLEDKQFLDFWNALLRHFSEVDIAVFALDSVAGGGDSQFIDAQPWFVASPAAMEPYFAMKVRVCLSRNISLSKSHRTEIGGAITYRDPDHLEHGDMDASYIYQSLVYEICQSFAGYSLHDLDSQVHGANFWVNDDESIYRSKFAPRPW